MNTKRESINLLRDKLKERNADSTYTNQFLFKVLMEQAKWLIRREISKGAVWSNQALFSTLRCLKVIEKPLIDDCCPVKTGCTIYRTKDKLPDIWMDSNGPIIRSVTSVDGSTSFMMTTSKIWESKSNDPYEKIGKHIYVFYANGYLWFPEHNPNLINIDAFFDDDVDRLSQCDGRDTSCKRYLDTKFMLPDWLTAEMYAKSLEIIAGVTKRLPEDMQIDKNPNRKS